MKTAAEWARECWALPTISATSVEHWIRAIQADALEAAAKLMDKRRGRWTTAYTESEDAKAIRALIPKPEWLRPRVKTEHFSDAEIAWLRACWRAAWQSAAEAQRESDAKAIHESAVGTIYEESVADLANQLRANPLMPCPDPEER